MTVTNKQYITCDMPHCQTGYDPSLESPEGWSHWRLDEKYTFQEFDLCPAHTPVILNILEPPIEDEELTQPGVIE